MHFDLTCKGYADSSAIISAPNLTCPERRSRSTPPARSRRQANRRRPCAGHNATTGRAPRDSRRAHHHWPRAKRQQYPKSSHPDSCGLQRRRRARSRLEPSKLSPPYRDRSPTDGGLRNHNAVRPSAADAASGLPLETRWQQPIDNPNSLRRTEAGKTQG